MKTEYIRNDIGGRQHVHIVRGTIIFNEHEKCRQIVVTEMVRHPQARPFLNDDRYVGRSVANVPFRSDVQPGDELVGLNFDGFGSVQKTVFANRDGTPFDVVIGYSGLLASR